MEKTAPARAIIKYNGSPAFNFSGRKYEIIPDRKITVNRAVRKYVSAEARTLAPHHGQRENSSAMRPHSQHGIALNRITFTDS